MMMIVVISTHCHRDNMANMKFELHKLNIKRYNVILAFFLFQDYTSEAIETLEKSSSSRFTLKV